MTVIKCPGLTVVSLIFMAKPGGEQMPFFSERKQAFSKPRRSLRLTWYDKHLALTEMSFIVFLSGVLWAFVPHSLPFFFSFTNWPKTGLCSRGCYSRGERHCPQGTQPQATQNRGGVSPSMLGCRRPTCPALTDVSAKCWYHHRMHCR